MIYPDLIIIIKFEVSVRKGKKTKRFSESSIIVFLFFNRKKKYAREIRAS